MHPATAEHIAARGATNFRPLNLTVTLPMCRILPLLSRQWTQRLRENLKACKQIANVDILISAGVEFNPATSIIANRLIRALCELYGGWGASGVSCT